MSILYFLFFKHLSVFVYVCLTLYNIEWQVWHLPYCPHISQGCCQSRLSLDTISVALKDDSMEHIRFLQRLNLLALDVTCSCGVQMSLGQKSDLTDGHIFRCSSCKTTKTVRRGSFFTKSKLRLSQWIIVIYCWVRQYPVTKACEELEPVLRQPLIYFSGWERCAALG